MPWEADCERHSAAVMAGLRADKAITTVVLALRWPAANHNPSAKGAVEGGAPGATMAGGRELASDIEALARVLAAAGKSVWILGPVPVSGHPVPRALYLHSLGFERGLDVRPRREEVEREFGWVEGILARLDEAGVARPLSVTPELCGAQYCRIAEGDIPLYFDNAHLSTHGAFAVSRVFDRVFQ